MSVKTGRHTTLRVFREDQPAAPLREVTTGDEITRELAAIGVRFERFFNDGPLPATDDQEAILAACASVVTYVQRHGQYRIVDVVRVVEGQPDTAPLRAKFLAEHSHSDDEVRYFVEGSGAFSLRAPGHVYQVICTRGDLVCVPATALHWFDMGTDPEFTAIRWFNNPDGWVGDFTGDPISERFPLYS